MKSAAGIKGKITSWDASITSAACEVRWWSFVGGRINPTLRHGRLTLLPGTQIIADHFLVSLRGDELTYPHFQDAVANLRNPAFWGDMNLWSVVFNSLLAIA